MLRNTQGSVSEQNMVVAGNWLVYFADEAVVGPAGTDLNGDADQVDSIPVAVKMNQGLETLLPVAARHAAVVLGEVYLEVDEAEDGVDWSGTNGTGDLVLLHWSEDTQALAFVDTLRIAPGGPAFLAVGGCLFYARATPAALPDETPLRRIDPDAPTTPVAIFMAAGTGTVECQLLGEREDLIVLALDEAPTAIDLDGDGDTMDGTVLGLLDGTADSATVVNVGLAMADASAPVEADLLGPNDWIVAFLVNEAAQGNASRNDDSPTAFPSPLLPATCSANDDDTDDDVLAYLEFADFVQGLATPVNTGLAGSERVLAGEDFVAVLCDEADTTNPCDLNGDSDTTDRVLRWVETTSFAAPIDPAELHALAIAVPGGSLGCAVLENRIVAVVDEAADGRDLDGKPQDHDLVAWLDPNDGPTATWTFAHQDPSRPGIGTSIFEDTDGDGLGDPSSGASEPYAGAGWFDAHTSGGRLLLAFQEEVPGTNPLVPSLNNNLDCGFVPKDTDLVDVLPVWADFEDGKVLDFDGIGFALDPANPGLVTGSTHVFFRVSEAADSYDHSKDGDLADVVIFRNPVFSCQPAVLGVASPLPGPCIVSDGLTGGAFVSSESSAGVDYNEDGDTSDLVVRYFLY